ncbi:MAG: phosphoribosylamine--glycine ligase [Actinobacteria bacterium]|nr:phosphoribosylamine--glycine ligase [Actinomycetota bacterium]
MRVLVVGGGGREHALLWGIARSPLLDTMYCAPGNAGTTRLAISIPVAADDIVGLRRFAVSERIDLTVVGPEAPLVAGLADEFRAAGLAVFGPGAKGAHIEGSKAFAKEVMRAAGVPTGTAAEFTMFSPAMAFVEDHGTPLVIKADGLAAGKGVFVAGSRREAEDALRSCLIEGRFGDAGRSVLVEEYLEGEEASLLALVSDGRVLPLAPAQDYKRALDGDAGPNTGGMGSYSPVPTVDADTASAIVDQIVRPTVDELERRGISYRGVLYAGVILTSQGPKVLEFNCRFGDPETQVMIPRMRSDLLRLLWATAQGEELPASVDWEPGACVGVVMASRGYPAGSSKGDTITGIVEAEALDGVTVFHAGTAERDGVLVTAGGRVLVVTALGADFAQAREKAYKGVGRIDFSGAQWRTDIGARAVGGRTS